MNKIIDTTSEENIDQEWVGLILSAKQLGLTPDEIRNFLRNDMKKEAI